MGHLLAIFIAAPNRRRIVIRTALHVTLPVADFGTGVLIKSLLNLLSLTEDTWVGLGSWATIILLVP